MFSHLNAARSSDFIVELLSSRSVTLHAGGALEVKIEVWSVGGYIGRTIASALRFVGMYSFVDAAEHMAKRSSNER